MEKIPRWMPGLALGAIILLAYANSFHAELTLDSRWIIGADPRIRSWTGENLQLIFTENYWWPATRSDLYRPLTTLTYLLNYSVLGNADRVAGYHVVNALIHWANAWLVFLLIRRAANSVPVAWLAAAIFSVHPVNVEAVTNLVGRADLLATLAILGGGWCYWRAADSAGSARRAWLGAAGLIGCLGVLAKESGVLVVPFVILGDIFWRRSAVDAEAPAARSLEAWWKRARNWAVFLSAVALLFWVRHRLAFELTPPGQAFVDNPIYFATRPLARTS